MCFPGRNDDSLTSGSSTPDGGFGKKALQSLSSGGSLSVQDLVRWMMQSFGFYYDQFVEFPR